MPASVLMLHSLLASVLMSHVASASAHPLLLVYQALVHMAAGLHAAMHHAAEHFSCASSFSNQFVSAAKMAS